MGLGVVAGGALIAPVGTIETKMPGLQGDLSPGQFAIVVAYAIFMICVCLLACSARRTIPSASLFDPSFDVLL